MGIPIDHGWAWAVCFGAFVNLFFVTGGLRSVGLLFIEISEKFGASRAMTAITVGFMGAGFGIFSPIGNMLGMRFTMRKVVFIGGFIAALSAALTSLAPNIYYIIFVFGVFTGVGYGLIFGPSLVMIGLYFDKRRSLANGLAAAGGSLGQLILPQLITVLIKNYTFSGCMLIIGALTFHSLPASLLYRPLSAYRKLPGKDPENLSKTVQVTQAKAQNNNQRSGIADNDVELVQKDPNDLVEPLMYDKNSTRSQSSLNKYNRRGSNSLTNALSRSKASLHASTHSIAAFQEVPQSEMVEEDITVAQMNQGGPGDQPPAKKPALDLSLFKNALFVIYVVGLTCGHGGYVNLCMFLPAYANEVGVDKDKVALLLSIIGLSDLCGRIIGGWFADLGLLKRSTIMAICLSFTGICAFLVPFLPLFPIFATLAVVTGLIGGVYVSLMAVVCIDFMGLARLASAFGLAMMFLGIGCIPIPIAIGLIKDTSGTFSHAIRLCGALMVIGGFCFSLEPVARRIEANKGN